MITLVIITKLQKPLIIHYKYITNIHDSSKSHKNGQ